MSNILQGEFGDSTTRELMDAIKEVVNSEYNIDALEPQYARLGTVLKYCKPGDEMFSVCHQFSTLHAMVTWAIRAANSQDRVDKCIKSAAAMMDLFDYRYVTHRDKVADIAIWLGLEDETSVFDFTLQMLQAIQEDIEEKWGITMMAPLVMRMVRVAISMGNEKDVEVGFSMEVGLAYTILLSDAVLAAENQVTADKIIQDTAFLVDLAEYKYSPATNE